jgi:hypothetical protein
VSSRAASTAFAASNRLELQVIAAGHIIKIDAIIQKVNAKDQDQIQTQTTFSSYLRPMPGWMRGCFRWSGLHKQVRLA